jgi:hypothetical protein
LAQLLVALEMKRRSDGGCASPSKRQQQKGEIEQKETSVNRDGKHVVEPISDARPAVTLNLFLAAMEIVCQTRALEVAHWPILHFLCTDISAWADENRANSIWTVLAAEPIVVLRQRFPSWPLHRLVVAMNTFWKFQYGLTWNVITMTHECTSRLLTSMNDAYKIDLPRIRALLLEQHPDAMLVTR